MSKIVLLFSGLDVRLLMTELYTLTCNAMKAQPVYFLLTVVSPVTCTRNVGPQYIDF